MVDSFNVHDHRSGGVRTICAAVNIANLPETDEKKAQKYLNRKLKEIHADQIGARVFVAPKQERITVSELLDALVTRYELKGKRSPQFDSHIRIHARHRCHCRNGGLLH
jgi:hypothetical protein